MKKKIFTIMCCLVFMFCLVGCGGDSQNDDLLETSAVGAKTLKQPIKEILMSNATTSDTPVGSFDVQVDHAYLVLSMSTDNVNMYKLEGSFTTDVACSIYVSGKANTNKSKTHSFTFYLTDNKVDAGLHSYTVYDYTIK